MRNIVLQVTVISYLSMFVLSYYITVKPMIDRLDNVM